MRRQLQSSALLAVAVAALASAPSAQAQAVPTADRSLRFAAFGAANGTWTGLDGGRNAGITAGVSVDLPAYRHLIPAIELRGTYPVKDGHVDSQRNILAGLRLARPLGDRLLPYADAFFGRGEINFLGTGYQKPGTLLFYTITSGNILAGGGGLEFALTPDRSFALKADAQLLHQSTPATTSGTLNSTQINLGLAWRPRFHRRKGVAETE